MNRHIRILAAVIVPLAVLTPSCSDDAVSVKLSSCAQLGPVERILDNHLPSGGDHELVVPATDVMAAVETTYDIRGDNVGHTHTVTLTATQFQTLRDGTGVTVKSSNNGPVGIGHDHTIELTCP